MGCFGVDGRIVSNTAIRVENLGKQYRIGATQARYRTIRETVTDAARAPFVRAGKLLRGEATGAANLDETIWALKDVSFEVKHGEVVGIIGRNGAGKSTLLKILSRITEPTTGFVDLYGRVGSLLEVGTGFHPELTGRENIFLNGAILGMSRNDINRKFDEIVDFAEVERFIDTPVKHYSSGMYLRLAFAVAAHLEPEILLVDEVLAVGDAAFQKKCLGKMGDVAQEGRTVLFVSHNMGAVRTLCPRSIWLDQGQIYDVGASEPIVDAYLRQDLHTDALAAVEKAIALLPPDPIFQLEGVDVRQDEKSTTLVVNGRPMEIEIRYSVRKATNGLRVYFDLLDEQEVILIRSFHDDDLDLIPAVQPGSYVSTAIIPAHLLAPRTYQLRIYGTIFNVRSLTPGGVKLPLQVESSGVINRGYPHDPVRSRLQPRLAWKTVCKSIEDEVKVHHLDSATIKES